MKKKIKLLVLAGIMAVMMAACKSGDNTSGSKQENQAKAETITVTDAKGRVEIPANPKRIVDLSGNSDISSVLGYSVVGTANSDAYDYTKFPSYLEDILSGAEILGYSMQDTMDVEGILELNPDLIIISSVQEKMYDQLTEIAPTVMIQLAQIDWKEDIQAVGKIMDKEAEADKWLAAYEEKAKEVGNKLKETYGEDTTYLSLLASGGQIFLFDAAGMGSILYTDMGLAKPEGMPEQENISLPVVTYEGLAEIDADYIFVIGTDDDTKALEESKIWQSMPAVSKGNYITLPASPYFNQGYSCIGRLGFLDEVAGIMEQINE